MARNSRNSAVLVVGLGRFGGALAETLVKLGTEVLGIDNDAKIVQSWAGRLTHVVEADSTDADALRQIGSQDFERAVVGIGTDIEASILTTAALVDLKVATIWAKAITQAHGRILDRVGAAHVVYPEHEMGRRVAHLVTGRMMDYIEFDDGFALVKTSPPKEIVGRPLGETGVRRRWGITVVSIKRTGEDFTYATQETVVQPEDVLIVAGRTAQAERFAAMT